MTDDTHPAENDATAAHRHLMETLCSACDRPGQCAACYLMECKGLPTPPRVTPPAVSDAE